MKLCNKCNQLLEDGLFFRNSQSRDGLRPSCKACEKPIKKIWAENNKEKIRELNQIWRDKNKTKWVEINVRNNKKYRHTNLRKKIEHSYRGSISKAMIQNYQSGITLELLGCSIDEYKKYIEGMFKEGMTWKNRGILWEIDHIIPLSKFDCTNFEEAKKGFNFSNTQVLYKQHHRNKTRTDIKDICASRR